MPRNADYGWNEKEDCVLATSRLEKSWGTKDVSRPEQTLEVRTFAAGAGSLRVGEIQIVGHPLFYEMTASITMLNDTLK